VINSAALLADLKRELRTLEDDLRVRADDEHNAWGARLREEHRRAQAKERTGLPWIDWRDGEVSQAAVAWIIAAVFVRFSEDNGLLRGGTREGALVSLPWIAAPGDGLERAIENESAFYAAAPTMTGRDWLEQAFRTLADLPAGRPLVDPDHSAVWHAPISADAADALLRFFRRTTPGGALVHDFSDPGLGTRFLGDLYQDLSDYAKKTYALLQTPVFVEEFILDHTLTPAIKEFGLAGLKLIDPACGSGHFLLGAFDRLVDAWATSAPGVERGERVQRALDSIHGVDLNPFAVAIARFRLTVAAIKAAGVRTLVAAPAFRYHLAIGDSLLGGSAHNEGLDLGDKDYFQYDNEDLRDYEGVLAPSQYHVVVANPPYIQPPDASLRDQYRRLYPMCHRKYALTSPFMELLFRLAKRPSSGGAGFVGQITSNSFMKREFGRKLIEQFLSGRFTGVTPDHVDLSHIIDTSGAYIPGHGTPTVILLGRPRRPHAPTIRAVLGVRGEPTQPVDPAEGLVWRDIVENIDHPGYHSPFISVADLPRQAFETFPWSLSGGGAGEVKDAMEAAARSRLGAEVLRIGFFGVQGSDEAFTLTADEARRREEPHAFIPFVSGDGVRDWEAYGSTPTFFPYSKTHELLPLEEFPRQARAMWRYRTELANRTTFSRKTYAAEGRPWYEWHQLPQDAGASPSCIAYAEVATHNHFVFDRGGRAFNKTAPVIKLRRTSTKDDHYNILGVLNSSAACFWLKQVAHNKGSTVSGDGARTTLAPWEDFYQFNATKLLVFPMPDDRARDLAQQIDDVAFEHRSVAPAQVIASNEIHDLPAKQEQWESFSRKMVALQEELDWRMYVSYGLADRELAPPVSEVVPIDPNERPVEIRLARSRVAGEVGDEWFQRHGREPVTAIRATWPDWYRILVERRIEAIESNPSLRLLERPEYKRRWNGSTWDQLRATAVREAILDRLEARELWQDGSNRPMVRSIAQLADALRRDERLRELLIIHTGSHDYDFGIELGKLVDAQAVPAVAALRYKPAGLQKFRAWERTWELQRAEDRGEHVAVDVPPKYTQADFLKQSYWSARGKLDVPKERFIAFPGSFYSEDTTASYGWAGWDHGERGQAIARFATELNRAGAPDDQVIPLVGALVEIEPWLRQWHDKIDARSGVSPAVAVTAVVNSLLDRLGLGRDAISEWRPMPTVRGRKKKV